jgi:hypothetical protein
MGLCTDDDDDDALRIALPMMMIEMMKTTMNVIN